MVLLEEEVQIEVKDKQDDNFRSECYYDVNGESEGYICKISVI